MTVHAGPYEGLGGVVGRARLGRGGPGMARGGRDDFWEEYLTEPTDDPSALRTRSGA